MTWVIETWMHPTHNPDSPHMAETPLVDRFGRRHTYLRISITERCNFHCSYCMPEPLDGGPKETLLSYEEIVRIAGVFARLGVTKVRLTGGEPTVRKGVETLVGHLSGLGFRHLLMTTNGSTLAAKWAIYKDAGLTGLNISLDSLDRGRFERISGRDELDRVRRGIEASLGAGFETIKINVVVMRGVNDDELERFLDEFADRDVEVRFIEFMPFDGNRWSRSLLVPYAEMRRRLAHLDLRPRASASEAVAREFDIPGRSCRVGFVTSMTESFCDGCNRVRLTADGSVKACLFSDKEVCLREPMRQGASDAELEALIRRAIDEKDRGHAPIDVLHRLPNRSMVRIGG